MNYAAGVVWKSLIPLTAAWIQVPAAVQQGENVLKPHCKSTGGVFDTQQIHTAFGSTLRYFLDPEEESGSVRSADEIIIMPGIRAAGRNHCLNDSFVCPSSPVAFLFISQPIVC